MWLLSKSIFEVVCTILIAIKLQDCSSNGPCVWTGHIVPVQFLLHSGGTIHFNVVLQLMSWLYLNNQSFQQFEHSHATNFWPLECGLCFSRVLVDGWHWTEYEEWKWKDKGRQPCRGCYNSDLHSWRDQKSIDMRTIMKQMIIEKVYYFLVVLIVVQGKQSWTWCPTPQLFEWCTHILEGERFTFQQECVSWGQYYLYVAYILNT